MAPCLKSIYNLSGKRVLVNIDGTLIIIDNDKSQPVNISIPNDEYMTIDRVNSDDMQGYRLRYENQNIFINDALGKNNGFLDAAIRTKYSDQIVRIQIFEKEMHLSGSCNNLGIYRPDSYPKYYRSVAARHVPGGGITVHGGEYDDDEEASTSMKDSPTQSTSTIMSSE